MVAKDTLSAPSHEKQSPTFPRNMDKANSPWLKKFHAFHSKNILIFQTVLENLLYSNVPIPVCNDDALMFLTINHYKANMDVPLIKIPKSYLTYN